MNRQQASKLLAYQYLAIAIACEIGVWGYYAYTTYARSTLFGRKMDPQESSPLWGMIVFTLAVPIVVFAFYRQSAILLRRGEFVRGVIDELGMQAGDFRDISYSYEVDNQTLSCRRSVCTIGLEDLSNGSSVAVIYDPQNPRRSRLAKELWFD